MIKYLPKPIPITTEEEKTLNYIARHDAEEQRKNPQKIFWYKEQESTE